MKLESLFQPSSIGVIWFLLVLYVSYGAYLVFTQERIVYQPTPQDFVGCREFRDAEKVAHQGTRMYFKDNGPRIVVLYHGNYGSACDRGLLARIFEQAGYSYLVVEYAGYSNDPERPTHERVKKDTENVVAYLGTKNFSKIVVAGESIGVGSAAYHASLMPPQRLLLISSFTRLSRIAHEHFWYYPTSLFVKDPFDASEFLADFTGELQLIHGEKDDIVPLSLGQELFESLTSSRKEMVIIPESGHNDLFTFTETYQTIADFLK